MTDYPIGMELVVDPDNPMNVVANGSVGIYAPEDTAGTTLLALKDLNGFPLANPLTSNAYGFTPAFLAPLPQVRWKSGEFSNVYNSFVGLRDEAVAAKNAAQEAQAQAVTAGANAADAATAAQTAATDAAAAAADELKEGYVKAFADTSVTYNPDETVASVTEAGITTTFSYNPDGTVATDTRLGVTRTYTYTNGLLTRIEAA